MMGLFFMEKLDDELMFFVVCVVQVRNLRNDDLWISTMTVTLNADLVNEGFQV